MDLFLPQTIEAAGGLLVQHAGARCSTGGATLVAMKNAGLVEPTALISLRQIPGLSGIAREADGSVRIGAMTRHVDTATSECFENGQRVVPYAAVRIANRVVRNMGTMGGSISFADPAADYLAALTATGKRRSTSPRLKAADRFRSPASSRIGTPLRLLPTKLLRRSMSRPRHRGRSVTTRSWRAFLETSRLFRLRSWRNSRAISVGLSASRWADADPPRCACGKRKLCSKEPR